MTPESFEKLHHDTEKSLYNCLFRWVWNREEAIDLVQEAFMKLWEKRENIDDTGAKAYLFRTALNMAIKKNRWRERWKMVGLDHISIFSTNLGSLFFKREEEQDLRNQINVLPEKIRQVLILVRFGELSYAETGALLGIPNGTVASRYHTAIDRLRQKMEGKG